MSEIILRKYHGVGNDYLIFDPKKNDVVLNERLIRQLCRRNIGVGADGILYGPVMEDKKLKYEFLIRMEVKLKKRQWHPDFSRYLKDAGYVKERQYYLTTKAGETLVTFWMMLEAVCVWIWDMRSLRQNRSRHLDLREKLWENRYFSATIFIMRPVYPWEIQIVLLCLRG